MRRRFCLIAGVWTSLMHQAPVWACATCFGDQDDPQTQGMNMAILTLMGVTYTLFLGMIGAAVVVWRKNRRDGLESGDKSGLNGAADGDAEVSHG